MGEKYIKEITKKGGNKNQYCTISLKQILLLQKKIESSFRQFILFMQYIVNLGSFQNF